MFSFRLDLVRSVMCFVFAMTNTYRVMRLSSAFAARQWASWQAFRFLCRFVLWLSMPFCFRSVLVLKTVLVFVFRFLFVLNENKTKTQNTVLLEPWS